MADTNELPALNYGILEPRQLFSSESSQSAAYSLLAERGAIPSPGTQWPARGV